MKRILVATDLSQRSRAAVERALTLARTRGAALRALHVRPPFPRFGRRLPPGVNPDAERERAADLLAVGARGHGAVQYALLGSTAEHVIRESPCDVLTVRDGPPRLELP